MFKDRSEYLEYRRRKWASGVIAISWIMHVKMSKVKVKLKVSREEHLENFRRRARVSYCENDQISQLVQIIITYLMEFRCIKVNSNSMYTCVIYILISISH